jgi:uncharacterized membrane protein YsdA (DUF1294 family)/predicted  nucleic acid-binding Zn-ribbon protein
MSNWVERVKNHPAIGKFATILTHIEQAEQLAGENTEAREALDRIHAVVMHAKRRFDVLDPVLIPKQSLQNLDSNLSSMLQTLQAYVNDKNKSHLQTAANNCDSLLLQLPISSGFDAMSYMDGIREAVGSFRESAAQQMRLVEEQSAGVQKKLSDLLRQVETTDKTIEVQKGRLDTAIGQFQKQFSDAESERGNQFSKLHNSQSDEFLKAEKARVDEAAKDLSLWTESLKKMGTEHEEEFRKINVRTEKNYDQMVTKFDTKAQGALDALDTKKKEAEDLVGLIANTGMATGYQRVADLEAKRAFRWHLVAGVSMVGLIVFAVYAFQETNDSSFKWTTLGTRVFVALAFGLAGVYAGRQADRHRLNERLSRRLELILLSVNPYLAELPDGERHMLKAKLAEQIFVSDHAEPDSKDGVPATNLYDLLKLVLDNLTKLKK